MRGVRRRVETPEEGYFIEREQMESAFHELLFSVYGLEETHELGAQFEALLDELEVEKGRVCFEGTWEKLDPADPRMDETERMLFPDETYLCTNCGGRAYFGAGCTRDRFCQFCGARMLNAGHRQGRGKKGESGAGKPIHEKGTDTAAGPAL